MLMPFAKKLNLDMNLVMHLQITLFDAKPGHSNLVQFCFNFRWFKNVDWEEVYYKQLKPPIVPKVSYDGDTRNFDEYPETDWRQVPGVSEREFRMFEDF